MLNEQSLVRAFKTLIVDKIAEIVDLIVVGSTLEPATADTLGGVKIGEGVNVTEDGTISVSTGGGLEWTLIDNTDTPREVTLPANYNDLMILAYHTDLYHYAFSFALNKGLIDTIVSLPSQKTLKHTESNSDGTNICGAVLDISHSGKIVLNDLFINGSSVATNKKRIIAWYR